MLEGSTASAGQQADHPKGRERLGALGALEEAVLRELLGVEQPLEPPT